MSMLEHTLKLEGVRRLEVITGTTSPAVSAAYKSVRALENFLEDKVKTLAKDEKTKGFVKDVQAMAEAAKVYSFAIAPGTISEPITKDYNEKIKGDMRILELLIRKDEEAVKNIGDPSALMGVYDIDEEEKSTIH